MSESPSLSKHLFESYEARHPHPHLQQQRSSGSLQAEPVPNLVQSGMTSYNANMHGAPSTYMPSQLYAFGNPQPVKSEYVEPSISVESATKIATLQAKLDMKLGPEYISTRPGPGGGPKLSYVEGWKVINLANEVFGFNGWSSAIVNLSVDFIDGTEETKKYSVGVSAIVRVTLRDGVFHEDVGYGLLENSKSKGAALDKCRKEAITDALKRTLRNFGNVLGNCLYDKNYASEIAKVKVQPIKLDKSRLHRHPDYDDTSTAQASTSANTSHSAPPPQQQQQPPPKQNINHPKVERPQPAPYQPQNQAPTAPKPNAPNPNPRPSAAPPAYTSRPTPPKPQPIPPAPAPQSVKAEPATSPHVGKVSAHQPDRQPPSDDNAYFHSDDDKFMAQCDFADETVPDDDLGRPIHDDLDETLVDDSSARLSSGQSPLQARNSRTSGLSTSPVQMKASSHPVAQSANIVPPNTGFQRSSSMRNENISGAQQAQQRQHQQPSRREMTIALIEAGQRPLQALDNNTTRQYTSPPNQNWQKPPIKQIHAQAQHQPQTGMTKGPLGNAVSGLKRDLGTMQSGGQGQGQGPQRPAEITPPWVQPGPISNVGPQVGGDGRDSKRPRR